MSDDSKVPGIPDDELRPELHEAYRVLQKAQDDYSRARAQCEAYVRPLEAAHDGDDAVSLAVQAQVSLFRTLYAIE